MEVRATLEDLMYVSILEKFLVLGVDMLPRLDGERQESMLHYRRAVRWGGGRYKGYIEHNACECAGAVALHLSHEAYNLCSSCWILQPVLGSCLK